MKIALMKEGFGHPTSDRTTDEKVRGAIAEFSALGATVDEVSVPIVLRRAAHVDRRNSRRRSQIVIKGYAMGNNWPGYYTTSLQEAFARGWQSRPDNMLTVKLVLILGEYMHRRYHNRYHAKAQNLRVLLRKAYDDVLDAYDLISMPTIPFPATKIPPPTARASTTSTPPSTCSRTRVPST